MLFTSSLSSCIAKPEAFGRSAVAYWLTSSGNNADGQSGQRGVSRSNIIVGNRLKLNCRDIAGRQRRLDSSSQSIMGNSRAFSHSCADCCEVNISVA